MNKKRKTLLRVILFIILAMYFPSYAHCETPISVTQAKRVISNYMSQRQIKAVFEEPVLYYHADGTPAVYVFTLNKEKGEFTTVVVAASMEDTPILMRYDGLPIHEASLDNAKQKAAEYLGADSVRLNRYVWEDFFAVFFEFSDEKGNLILVNAYSGEILTAPEVNAKIIETDTFYKTDLYKQKVGRCKESWKESVTAGSSTTGQSTIERKITGVPDYLQVWFTGNNDCAPTAAASALAYWDDHARYADKYIYERLVDYGDSDFDVNFDGVTGLVWELKTAMNWNSLDGTLIRNVPTGIAEVCNAAAYGNNYNFTTHMMPDPPPDPVPPDWIPPPPPSWEEVISEIDSKRPETFSIVHPFYGSGNHTICVVGYAVDSGNYLIVHDNWTQVDIELSFSGITRGYLTRIVPGTTEPPNINCAQACIGHGYRYFTFEDFILNEPVLMEETWKWFVANLVDTGEDVANVKFTANCPFSVVWKGQLPSSENPPVYVWDYGISIPQDMHYGADSYIGSGAQITSPVWATRQAAPEVLVNDETMQIVIAQVIFTALPPGDVNVGIGVPRGVPVGREGLIQCEIISQNDLPDWNERLEWFGMSNWHILHDKIQLNTLYTFVAQIKATKSPQVVGKRVLWKPCVGIEMENWLFTTPPKAGSSCQLTNPDGVTVTFDASGNIGWEAYLNAGGIDEAMWLMLNVAPAFDPIGNKSVDEGHVLTFIVSATDMDNDTLTYSESNLPQGASFNANTRTFTWTPDYAQANTYTNVHFEVTDGTFTESEDIAITVNNTNRPPVLNSIGNKSVDEGSPLQFTIFATDRDQDALTYSASNLPQGASFNQATRTFSWKPSSTQAGIYNNIHFQVSDNKDTDSEDITITVNDTGGGGVGDEIIADFGSNGIWVRYPDGIWANIHGWNPEATVTADINGDSKTEIILDFGSNGIWARYSDGTMSNIHGLNPEAIARGDINGDGKDELIFDFGGQGIWIRHYDGSLSNLHGFDPEGIATGDINGDGKEEIIIDFGTDGVWIHYDDGSWSNIHGINSETIITADITGDAKKEIIVDFGSSYGVWAYLSDGTWTQLHGWNPETIATGDINGDGKDELIFDFGISGVWTRDAAGNLSNIHGWNPQQTAAGDINADGKDELIFDFGSDGIWTRTAEGMMFNIHGWNPEQITAGNIDGV